MAAKPKILPEEWVRIKEIWESDPRAGFVWLVKELAIPVSAPAVRKVSVKEEWLKKCAEKPSILPKETIAESPKKNNKTIKEMGKSKPKSNQESKVSQSKVSRSIVNRETFEETIIEDKAESKRNPGGRPTLYREEYAKQAYRLCLLGATDEDLAEAFYVSKLTIFNWKSEHTEFLYSITQGKIEADAKVAESTYKLAIGDVYIEEEKFTRCGDIVKLRRQIPPDPAAQRMWLFNRRPKQWKNKVEVKEEVNLNILPPKEILDEIYAKAFAEAEKRRDALIGRAERLGLVIDNDTEDLIDDL